MATITRTATLPDSANKADFYNLVDSATVGTIVNNDISAAAAIAASKLSLDNVTLGLRDITLTVDDGDNKTALTIVNNDSTNDPTAISLTNAGNGIGLYINQTGTLGSSKYALNIYSNTAQTTSPLIYAKLDNASSDQNIFTAINDGTGACLACAQNNTGAILVIQGACDSASTTTGLAMNLANDGAGLEFAFEFAGSEAVTAAVGGSQKKKIRVNVGGTTMYIPCYTA